MRPIHLAAALMVLAGCPSDDTDPTDTDTDTDPSSLCGEDGVGILSGTYTEDLTLGPDCSWVLSGGVFIGEDVGIDGSAGTAATLHIEAGTTIYGTSGSFLVIQRGSKIDARGTATAPIVFTSDQPEGDRGRGNWGGLVIAGRAPINACASGPQDCEATGEGTNAMYGGNDPADDSGALEYVRVEYGGTEISTDNELNGITFAGVGSGTTVDHVQVHMNLDDGVEFFGGTVNAKHVVVSCAGDDGIDWDLGYQGNLQFGLVAQCDDQGGNGIEADGNEADHTREPYSLPTLSNLTFVGSTSIAEDNFGILLRRGTGAVVHNTILTNWPAACLAIRDEASYAHADSGDLAFEHSIIHCDTAFEQDDTEPMDESAIWQAGTGNAEVDPRIGTGIDAHDYVPAAGSPAASGGEAPSGSFFEPVSYIGAFPAGGADWTDGWTNWAQD